MNIPAGCIIGIIIAIIGVFVLGWMQPVLDIGRGLLSGLIMGCGLTTTAIFYLERR